MNQYCQVLKPVTISFLKKITNENKVSHIYYEAPKKRMELSYEDLPGVVKAGKLEIIKGHKYNFYMNPVKNFK